MNKIWKDFFSKKSRKYEFYLGLALFLTIVPMAPPIMNRVESRQGILLPDVILDLFPRYDVSMLIMAILYGTIIGTFVFLLRYPKDLLTGFKCYFLVTFARYICIMLIPLEPPVGLIPLKDPILALFVYESHNITKDLFFSGHMASACTMLLCVQNKKLKIFLGIIALAVGILLLVQHIHYSYDVLFAPFATYVAYKLALKDWLAPVFKK